MAQHLSAQMSTNSPIRIADSERPAAPSATINVIYAPIQVAIQTAFIFRWISWLRRGCNWFQQPTQRSRRLRSSRPQPFRLANDHIAPKFESAVHSQPHSAAQSCLHQGAMRIAQSHFPWEPSILDGGDWGCAGASVMSTDSDNVSSGLCHSGGDNSYAGTRNQFHPDPRAWIYRAQVIDQLCQILDAVDIVMRRRRDQHHFRHSVPQACDVDAHFAGWQS